MTITSDQLPTLSQPRAPRDRDVFRATSVSTLCEPADASRANGSYDEHAELLRLRAEKAQLQHRVNELNLQLTLVKAAAALIVGGRGRVGQGSMSTPEVA